MNKHFKRTLIYTLAIMLLITIPQLTQAQPGDPSCDPLDPACPIDGGISLLIAAGVGIGAAKAYKTKHQNENLK